MPRIVVNFAAAAGIMSSMGASSLSGQQQVLVTVTAVTNPIPPGSCTRIVTDVRNELNQQLTLENGVPLQWGNYDFTSSNGVDFEWRGTPSGEYELCAKPGAGAVSTQVTATIKGMAYNGSTVVAVGGPAVAAVPGQPNVAPPTTAAGAAAGAAQGQAPPAHAPPAPAGQAAVGSAASAPAAGGAAVGPAGPANPSGGAGAAGPPAGVGPAANSGVGPAANPSGGAAAAAGPAGTPAATSGAGAVAGGAPAAAGQAQLPTYSNPAAAAGAAAAGPPPVASGGVGGVPGQPQPVVYSGAAPAGEVVTAATPAQPEQKKKKKGGFFDKIGKHIKDKANEVKTQTTDNLAASATQVVDATAQTGSNLVAGASAQVSSAAQSKVGSVGNALVPSSLKLGGRGDNLDLAIKSGKAVMRSIRFNPGLEAIDATGLLEVGRLAAVLNENPGNYYLKIHVDPIPGGDPQGLSERRADAVKRELIKKGVLGTRLKAAGYGASEPMPEAQPGGGPPTSERVEILKAQ